MDAQQLREGFLAVTPTFSVCAQVAPDRALKISFHGRLSLAAC
jgi:hypothetical protein